MTDRKNCEIPEGYDPLNPGAQVLVAIGSFIVHHEELHSPNGHELDKTAMDSILGDVTIPVAPREPPSH